MNLRMQVIQSIFKRNFSSYFSGALGYLFIVVFVAIAGAIAFNARFFTANEPNLDQLSNWYPLLLLFFIPAITMSVWAEEKRQGTDELLLTLPAGDFDIVVGKYLAAASIFSVSLLFSQIANYLVLCTLSEFDLDTGLFFSTYLGYWLTNRFLVAALHVIAKRTAHTWDDALIQHRRLLRQEFRRQRRLDTLGGKVIDDHTLAANRLGKIVRAGLALHGCIDGGQQQVGDTFDGG